MSYLITFVICAVFMGLFFLLMQVGNWALDLVMGWIGKFFLMVTKMTQGGTGTGNNATLIQEAEAYAHDWRLHIVACAGKFAKVDGVVTKRELVVMEEVFETLELTGALRPLAIDTFQFAKKGPVIFQKRVRSSFATA